MTDKDLRTELRDLHDQIEKSLHKEPADKDMVGHLMADLVRISQGEELHPEEEQELRDQLEQHAYDFEARHPRVAGIFRDVMDVLARLGI